MSDTKKDTNTERAQYFARIMRLSVGEDVEPDDELDYQQIHLIAHTLESLAAERDEAVAEVERLRGELLEIIEDAFLEIAMQIEDGDGDKAGWYDSMARSDCVGYGDQLVSLGKWERHPDGYGRRWFYRPSPERRREIFNTPPPGDTQNGEEAAPIFRKKPIEIQAYRWSGDMHDAMTVPWIEQAAGESLTFNFTIDDPRGQVEIETLEGTMVASPGDWIIRGVEGELYPCKPGILSKTYDPVNAAAVRAMNEQSGEEASDDDPN